ncbi:MAG TPA: hypothetical protein DC049_12585 [Spirochaetia bacterium]|nr:hypothetical protein [Spirochaetia bacterium]
MNRLFPPYEYIHILYCRHIKLTRIFNVKTGFLDNFYLVDYNNIMPFKEKYKHIAADLENRVKSARFRNYLPSQPELMKYYNSAKRTISRAVAVLKNKNLIIHEKGLGNRILKKNENPGKHPPVTIALFIALDFDCPFMYFFSFEYIRGLTRYCTRNNIAIEIYDIAKADLLEIVMRNFKNRRTGAVVYVPYVYNFNRSFIKKIKKMKLPLITIVDLPARYRQLISTVDYSNREIMYALSKKINHRFRTYLLTLPVQKYVWQRERIKFFKKFFPAGKIINNLNTAELTGTNFEIRYGYDLIKTNLEKISFPANIIGINTAIAFGAMNFLKKKKIPIPGQVQIFGIGNSDRLQQDLLSAMEMPGYKLGHHTAKIINENLADLKNGKIFHIRLHSRFNKGLSSE